MSKQFIYLVSVLFMIVGAISSVPAEENTFLLNNNTVDAASIVSLNETLNATTSEPMNATSNETTIVAPNENLNNIANETLNQTGLNETISALNEIVPVQNVTIEENATSEVMQANNARDTATVSQPEIFQIGSSENIIFNIGSGLESNDIFQINGNIGPQKAYEVGKPQNRL